MKEFKNIDRLYQEKFRDFEMEPSDKVWDTIEKTIHNKQKKDRPILWWWFSGIAAGLALLLYLNVNNSKSSSIENHTTDTKINKDKNIFKNNNPTTNTNHLVTDKEIIETKNSKTTPLTRNIPQKTLQKQTPKNQILITKTPSASKHLNISNSPVKRKTITTNKKHQLIALSKTNEKINITKKEVIKTTSNQNLAENSHSDVIEKQSHKDKWSVTTFAAPVYLNSFDKNTSSIDTQFNKNTKQGSFSSAYGVQIAYQINNKFSLQSGVQVVDYGYKTYDVYVSPGGAVNHYANINYNEEANVINIYALPTVQNQQGETIIQETKGNIMQVFGYVEIPLEIKYQINEGKGFNLNLVGGFSTLLLNKNQIFIETDGLSSRLGEASNLNPLNFSGNVGLEFNYKLFKNFNFNMVPMLKVQTQTFKKNSGGFSPYAIGVYSGLNYRF